MNRISRPSPAIVVAVLALVAALAGTAIAEVATTARLDKKEKKQVKKIAKKQINKLAPGLSVANADSANQLGGLGPASYVGSTIRSRVTTVNVPFQSTRSAQAACEAGETLIAGGAAIGLATDDDSWLIHSRPANSTTNTGAPANGNTFGAWRATARQEEGVGEVRNLNVFAVCATN